MFIKRLAFLALMTVVGALIGLIAGSYLQSDKRISWAYVGVPPEAPVRFINTYRGFLIEGSSGLLYAGCGLDCWTSDNLESYLQYEVEDLRCIERSPPDLPWLDERASFCEPWGAGMIYRNYGVSESGAVHEWESRAGEWDFLGTLLFPFGGALALFLMGVIAVLAVGFYDLLEHLRRKAIDEKVQS